MPDWLIQPLGPKHVRDQFDSGKEPLNEFLRAQAGQYGRKNIARTYVAVLGESPRVLGYYSLAAGHVERTDLPPTVAKKLPRHSVPIALLARLAIDSSVQGQGLGAWLLKDALERCAGLGDAIGIFAVAVDAIDDEAAEFYLKYGFVPLADEPRRLFLPLETICKGLGNGSA